MSVPDCPRHAGALNPSPVSPPGTPTTAGSDHLRSHLSEITDRVVWYVTCLRDAWLGHSVRGMDEARAGYDRAISELARISSQFEEKNS